MVPLIDLLFVALLLVGWIAATTFISTQLLLVFATVAFVDYGLALFDFLAVYAFLLWRASNLPGWLGHQALPPRPTAHIK